MKNKRGQVAIFVVIAIVIVMLIALFFVFSSSVTELIEGEVSPNSFLKECIQPTIDENIQVLSRQGGYRNPDGYVMYQGEKIKYLCYTSEYYKTCTVQQPMIKNHFEEELNDAVESKATACGRSLINEYERRGYEVSYSSINSETSIQPGKILVEIDAPMAITKGTTERFEGFDIEIESEMYDLLFTASSIIDYESSLGDSATEIYLQYYPDLKIDKTKLSDGTTIYKITNVVTNEEFTFASRSLAWPAGYGLEEI